MSDDDALPSEPEEPEDDGSRDHGATDQTPNAADPRAVARAKQKAKFDAEQVAAFWRRCLGDPIGRRVLWGVIHSRCRTFEDRFACTPAGFPSPEATWFQAGEKAVGMSLYQTLMRADLPLTLLMHQEHDPTQVQPKPRRARQNAPD